MEQMEDTLAWLKKRQDRCGEMAEASTLPADQIAYTKSMLRYAHHANHVRLLRETLKTRWCPKCCATSPNDIRCGVCDGLLIIDMAAVRRVLPDELVTS